MIVKFEKIISCSSEHPSYPAANLLQNNTDKWKVAWRCAKPGEMLAHVIFQLAEPSYVTGVDIGNYQSCVVIVTGSTSLEPDKWIVIVNHKFMKNEEAVNNKFKDQVQLFTKKELNPDTLKIKFDRIKVTCMQSANLKVLFGLSYIILRSDVIVDLGLDIFGRFKLKEPHVMKTPLEMMKEKFLSETENKKLDYKEELHEKIKENSMENFLKTQQEQKPMKRPILEKLEAGKADEVFGKNDKKGKTQLQDLKDKDKTPNKSPKKTNSKPNEKVVARTPFGDIMSSKNISKTDTDSTIQSSSSSKKRPLSEPEASPHERHNEKKIYSSAQQCTKCQKESQDQLCKTCQRLPRPIVTKGITPKIKNNTPARRKKPFTELLSDVTFSLSGYVNPQRDEIRRKAINMGARYIPNPNTTNKKCTHLICAFKNTPKYQQFKSHSKIVSHSYIEECFDKKIRFPWRRYALEQNDKLQPESEEEIDSSQPETDAYDVETDPESDY